VLQFDKRHDSMREDNRLIATFLANVYKRFFLFSHVFTLLTFLFPSELL